MIIYIHGFGGSGLGVKSSLFREYFKSKKLNFLSPSLSYVPELAIQTLEELINSYDENITLIGSSLGGYYALYLANKYNLKAILINPSILPFCTLDNYKGNAKNFYDNSTFLWNEKHILALKKYEIKIKNKENFFLLVQKGDELLDYKIAVEFLESCKMTIQDNGNHSFENIQKHFKSILEFIMSKS